MQLEQQLHFLSNIKSPNGLESKWAASLKVDGEVLNWTVCETWWSWGLKVNGFKNWTVQFDSNERLFWLKHVQFLRKITF